MVNIKVLPVKKYNHDIISISGSLEEETTQTGRSYKTPDGSFPSVTTVVGFEKQKFFSNWRSKNP
ncbi:MAG: hypothetical protein ACK55I_37825, partial [bacterium]